MTLSIIKDRLRFLVILVQKNLLKNIYVLKLEGILVSTQNLRQ